MNLSAFLGLNTAGFLGPLGGASKGIAGFRSLLGSIAGPLATITGGLLTVGAAAAFLKSSINAAANMENLEGSFTTLLGSTALAKQRMKDLADFAASTPFELAGIAQASKLLQAFTGNALSTGAGLRLVGDSAAAVGQPLEAVSMWFGRLYSGLKDGQPLGEPIQNLTQLGLISSEARKSLMALQGQSLSNVAAMGVLQQAFGSNAGAMARLSATYDGKVSTMRDNWDALKVELGSPVRDALKPFIDSASAAIQNMIPAAQAVGKHLATGLTVFRQAWADGSIGGLVGDVLSIGFASAVNILMKGVNGVAVGLGTLLDTLPGYLAAAFGLYAKADFWMATGQLVLGAFQSIGGELLNIFMKPITAMQAGVDTIVQNLAEGLGKLPVIGEKLGLKDFKAQSFNQNLADRQKDGFFLKDAAGMSSEAGAKNIVEASSKLLAITAETRSEAAKVGAGLVEGFKKGYAEGGGLLKEFSDAAALRLGERLKAAKDANIAGSAPGADPIKGEPGKTTGGVGKLSDIISDRLSKIGGFIGGAGGPSIDFNRRTASATEKTARAVEKIASRESAAPSTATAVYA